MRHVAVFSVVAIAAVTLSPLAGSALTDPGAHPKGGGTYLGHSSGGGVCPASCKAVVHMARTGGRLTGRLWAEIQITDGSYFQCDCSGDFAHALRFHGRLTTRRKFQASSVNKERGDHIVREVTGGYATEPWPCPCVASFRTAVSGTFYRARNGILRAVKGRYRTHVTIKNRHGKVLGHAATNSDPGAPPSVQTTFKAKLVASG